MAVDGAIRIKTKIDNSDIPKGLNEAQKQIQKLDKEIQKQQKAIDTATKGRDAISPQMSKYEEEVKCAREFGEQAKANARTEQQRLGYEETTAKEIDRIKEKYAETLAKAEQYNNTIEAASNHIRELRAEQTSIQSSMEGVQNAQSGVTHETADTARQSRRFGDSLKSAASRVKEMAQLLGGKVLSGAKKVASAIGNMAGKFKQLVTHNKSLNTGLGASAKNFAKMALSMFSVQSVFSMLSKAANAYLSDNQELNDRIRDMWSTLGAFMGPAIETIVAWLEKGIAYLNAFVKALTGIDIVAKRNAQAIEKQADAQESLSSAAFDEQNKLSDTSADTSAEDGSSGFNVEVIQAPAWMERAADKLKEIGSLLKAGEWKKAATTLTSALNGIVKNVDWAELGDKLGYYIDGALTFLATSILTFDWFNLGSSLATGINSLVGSVDWTNLGVVLGAGAIILIEGLGGLFATLDWEGLGQGLADAFNGLWTAIDWEQAGKTVSDGINGIAATINSFFDRLDPEQMGTQLGATFNNGIAGINWPELGEALTAGIDALLLLAVGFIQTFDFVQFGDGLADGIMGAWNNISWGEAGAGLAGGAVGLLETIGALLSGLDWEQIASDIQIFCENLLDSLATWLIDVDWRAFHEGLKTGLGDFMDGFDFDSLSTSLFNFAGAFIGSLGSYIVSRAITIKESVEELCEYILDYFDDYVDWDDWEDAPENVIKGLLEGIKDALVGIGTWIYDNIWVPFRDGFKDAFGIHSPSTKTKEFGRYLIDGLLLGIGNVWESVKSKFDDFANKVAGFKTTVKNKAKDVGNAVSNGLKDGMSNLAEFVKSPINALLTNIEKAFNSIIDKLNTFRIDVPDWLSDITGMDSFGFDFKRISIPRLALGGIVNNPGRGVPAIIGEAGKEAVLPLENNTEWMDMLAERLNGGERNIVVQVILSGKKIHEEMIKLSDKRNFATNGVM